VTPAPQQRAATPYVSALMLPGAQASLRRVTSSLLALLDDIATLLDDVATMTQVATKKTAGVLGDDLALNAQQVTGVHAEREIPVVWAVAKGSFVNKVILVPAALAISAIAPWAVTPLLMVGGGFLCFEGFEKIAHKDQPEDETERKSRLEAIANEQVDMVAFEKTKIKGAVRTDFILSAEIVVISLGTVQHATFWSRVAVLSAISVIMTIGVYGLVAGIVKLDDLGMYLTRRASKVAHVVGRGLLRGAPYLMKALSIAGTVAMFLVGGGILSHGIPPVEHATHVVEVAAGKVALVGGALQGLVSLLGDGLVGLVAGALILAVVSAIKRVRRGPPAAKAS
jgi:hypothetical protein